MIDAKKIKELRDQTGLSFGHCKQALEEAGGDLTKAVELLRAKGESVAGKKADRALGAGTVAVYLHNGGQIGAMLLLRSETDFVAKNAEFKALAEDLAMQVAATAPESLETFLAEPFIKNPDSTVGEMVKSAVHKFGERIEVGQFSRLDAQV
mgnify:FL=1